MRTFVSALLLGVCLSVIAANASGRATYSEALTINEVGLHGKRVVLSRHNASVYPPTYELSPDHRQVAYVPFTCETCTPSELWIADVRSSTDRLIVQAPSQITAIAWAPATRTIAVSGSATWLVQADGTGFRRIGDGGYDLAWSPDGSMLAMTGVDSRLRSFVKVLSIKTGITRDIAPGFRPQWSPNGRFLLYEFVTGRHEDLKIRIVRAAGGKPRTVARGSLATWSPDGRRIAFIRYPPKRNKATLWVAPSRGGRPHALAHAVGESSLSWSPGGRSLAFTRSALHSGRCDPFACDGLYVVPTSGGRPRQLAVERRLITPLAWSRDGRRLLYAGAILPGG